MSSVRVQVITLGGTIAMTGGSGVPGVVPRLSGEDLVAAVPGLADGVALAVDDFRQVPSGSIVLDDVVALAGRIETAAAAGADGFVVTQGTDTLEETSFLVDLLYGGEAPVVFTGAMRSPAAPGADGPANLLAAVRTAADPAARGLGALVAFADEIHAARYVRKVHTTSVAGFASPSAGPVGHVVEGVPRLHFSLPRHDALPAPLRPATVELVHATLGGSPGVLAGLGQHADGLVVAGVGAGHVPESWAEPLQGLAGRMPVVLASRIGTGSVLTSTYGYPGSESDLLARGLVGAGRLDPYKARLLLWALLAAEADASTIRAEFARRG